MFGNFSKCKCEHVKKGVYKAYIDIDRGGKLLLQEVTTPNKLGSSFVFALLPG